MTPVPQPPVAAHAFLAPSSAHRWVACPGSALMESRYPEQGDKEAAAEGTAAHWVMQQLFEGWSGDLMLSEHWADPQGVPITREMVEAAQLIVDDVRATLGAHPPTIEQRVAIPRVHALNWGTPDVRAWQPTIAQVFHGETTLYLWDFKFGHKHVEVYENLQLADYAAGCLDEMRHVPDERITVVMRVVQPRSYHRDGPIREWRVRASELARYVHMLSMAADEATSPAPECRPEPDACENCSARHACGALQRAAYRGMDLAMQAQADDLTPAALGLELRYLTEAARLMDARMTGLQSQAESLLRQAVSVPHWTMEAGSSRWKWNKPDAEVIALGEMLGVPLAKEPEAITPTQAKAAAKKAGVPESVFGAYSFQPPGAIKLTLDDGTAARRTFANP